MPNRFHTLIILACTLTALVTDAVADQLISIPDASRQDYETLDRLGDFWGVDPKTGAVTMYVDADQRAAIEALGFTTEIDRQRLRSLDYARAIDPVAWRRAGLSGIPGYTCYRTVDETKADLSALATDYPDLARWESIGETWLETNGQPGGDDIYVLVLGNQSSPHEKAPFVLMAAQHARELATAETAARFAEWLVENYASDPTARWLLDHREIHVIAQQNPDGRRQAENGPTLWRKNSNLNACPGGNPGVDLNRNSDYFWGTFSSSSACDGTYRGSAESSEPETRAVQNYMHQVFEPQWPNGSGNDPVPDDAQGLFISLHSFGQQVMFAWEGSGSGAANHAPNHDQMAWLGRKFGFHTRYETGRDILYSAGGTTPDYAYGEFGVAAYTFEIGTTFHQGCTYFEQNMVQDLVDALIYAAKAARRPYQAPSGPDVTQALGVWNSRAGTLRLSGMVDGTRFYRGGVSEAPADDPVFDVAEIRASFDLPPDQAASHFSLAPETSSPVAAFEALVSPSQPVALPTLLFLQAVDAQGNVGVPEAVWVSEQQAAVSPASLSVTLPAGQSTRQTVTISNIGSELLNWSIEADVPAAAQAGHDPALDETLAVADFALPGNASVSTTSAAGIASRGQVIGLTFEGTVSGLGGSSWASDMAMTITSPDNTGWSVGGYQTGNPDWAFQGSGSGSNGRYTSTHIGPDIFGSEGTPDEGQWQLDFDNTWSGSMNWSEVTVTLHKQEPPKCSNAAGVAWLSVDQAGGAIVPGEDALVEVTIDAANLDIGIHQALLCITTDDPVTELIVVDVQAEVINGVPEIFDDRFENRLR